MKAGIIAAGLGERLVRGGVTTPKPLVEILGEPLIARTIRAASEAGAEEIACIVNDVYPETADFLRNTSWPVPLNLVVKTTPSSMESFFQLEPYLRDASFLLLTVDAIFPKGLLGTFVQKAKARKDAHGVLAVTPYVDDEKPLRVVLDTNHRIVDMGTGVHESSHITAGFYYFSPVVYNEMTLSRKRKYSAFREFLTHLVNNNYSLFGEEVGKTVDVDVPVDIEKAEDFLKKEDRFV